MRRATLLILLAAVTLAGCSSTSTVRVQPDEQTSVHAKAPDTTVGPGTPALAPTAEVEADTSAPVGARAFTDTLAAPAQAFTSIQVRPAEDVFYVTTPTGRLAIDLPEEGETATVRPDTTAEADTTAAAPPDLLTLVRGSPEVTYREAKIPEGAGESWAEKVWGKVQSGAVWIVLLAAVGGALYFGLGGGPLSLLTRLLR
jgi:hypothetical protein